MKIVFFISKISDSGGSERVSTVIANQLAENGHEVVFITWMGSTTSFFELNSNISVISLFDKDVNIYRQYISSLWRYYKLIKRLKPNYIVDVCTALSLISIPASFLARIKVISWEHFNTNVEWNPVTSRLSRWLAAKFAYRVVVLTETDKKNYEVRFNAKNVDCISNPVTVNVTQLCDLYAKNILSIGRFTDQKGFDLLITAWEKVVKQLPDWTLRIVGNGELKEDVKQLISKLGLNNSVELIEPTKYIEQYYSSSSIYVMSSRYEGLPLVLIEAKAYGMPIVSFDCDTGPRDIIRNNVDGLLVEAGSVYLLVESMLQLMKSVDIRETYSKNALADLERFDMPAIVLKWLSILK